MMRMGIRSVLSAESNIVVVGEVDRGDEVIATVKSCCPDIVLMDINMPGTSGLEVTRLLRREIPDVRVIVLTMYDDREYVAPFINSGASGYVLKKNPPGELIQAINAVYCGGAFFSPSISQMLLEEHRHALQNPFSDELTPRERQVLRLVAKGYSTKQIADMMFLAERTVNKYREAIMQKLDVHSVTELIRTAIAKKLIDVKDL